jgi:UDP-N-acetylmuramoyl-tripeptide--D-alanyl-D-alanine ligase
VTARFTESEVLEATGGRLARAGARPAFDGVSTDTRTLTPGALFVALKGDRFDAHGFLGEAFAKGAAGAVVRRGSAAPDGGAVVEVDDTLAALGALARFHRARFAIPVGAVAGSNGKTTTKEMVAAILRTRGPALATEGNLNNEVGVPLTLLRLGEEHRAAVVELGTSGPGELARLTAMAGPDAGVVTLVAEEHLEFLKDLDGVAEAEGELYAGLRPGAVAVVNADDPRCVAQAERAATGVRRISFGKSPGADVRLLRVTPLGVEGQEICLEGEEGEGDGGAGRVRLESNLQRNRVTVRLGFVGEHNAMNAAAAAALALSLSFSFEEIAAGLAAARPYAHRSRVVRMPSGLLVLDDCYNASPASMEAALATLASLRGDGPGRTVAVLGDMLELGAAEESAHRQLGRSARGRVDVAAFFGPRTSSSLEEFSSSPPSSPSSSSAHFTEIEPLLAWLRPRLRAGDVLLVKGSRGMKLERVVDALAA